MRKIFCLGLLGCMLLTFPGFSIANTTNVLSMEELSIQVMPDFAYHPDDKEKDQSPLLIGYHGTLINNSEQPQIGRVEIPLPMDTKNFRIGYVAEYTRDLSEMIEIEYELDKEKGTVSWETNEEIHPKELYKFVVEFYSNEIEMNNDTKNLTYTFKSFTDIGMLNILFVEPMQTESFKLEPTSDSHQKNTYGMNMFIYQLRSVKEQDEKTIELEYKRTTSNTTTEILEAMTGKADSEASAKKNETIPTWVAVTTASTLSVVLAAAVILFLKRKRKNPSIKPNKADHTDIEHKKARLRAMLVEGTITESEYQQLLKKLEKK